MADSFQFNSSEFQKMAKQLRDIKKFSSAEMLTYLGKMLAGYLIKCTPPFGKHPFQESSKSQEDMGRKSVERDLRKLFIPLGLARLAELQKLGHFPRRALVYIRKYAREGQDGKLDKILRDLGLIDKSFVVKRATLSMNHAQYIGFYRRPHKVKQRVYVLNAKSIDMLIAEVKKHVGTAKAGWIRAADQLKLGARTIPGWVRKQSARAVGAFEDGRFADNIPFFSMVNSTVGADAPESDVVIVAMTELQRSGLQKQLEHIFNKRAGYFNSDQRQPRQLLT